MMFLRSQTLKLILSLILFGITFNGIAQVSARSLAEKTMADSLRGMDQDSSRCKMLYSLIETEYNDSIWEVYNKELNRIAAYNMSKGSKEYRLFFSYFYSLSVVNFGYIEMERNNFDKAEKYYKEGLELQLKNNDKSGIANTYSNLGYLMRHRGNTDKALDYYYEALKIHTADKWKPGIAVCYNNIGYVHETQGDYEKALECFNRSAVLLKELNDKDGMGITYVNIGALLSEHVDVICKTDAKDCAIKAIHYIKQAIAYQREIKNYAGLARSLNILGGIFYKNGDPLCIDPECHARTKQIALDHLSEALRIRKEVGDTLGLSQSYYALSDFMLMEGKLKEASEKGMLSMAFAKRSGTPEQIGSTAELLKNIYQKQNKFKEALEMYDLFHRMKDSVNNESTRKANIKKQFKVQYEIQAAKDSIENRSRINEQKIKHEQDISKQRMYTYSGFAGLMLMLLVAIVSFRAYQNKQKANVLITKQKQVIEEKQKEILDSINYAKRIQKAHLPQEKYISKKMKDLRDKGV